MENGKDHEMKTVDDVGRSAYCELVVPFILRTIKHQDMARSSLDCSLPSCVTSS